MEETEIERRYLLTDDQAQALLKGTKKGVRMVDYYVPNQRSHMDLRVRKNGDKYCITRKTPVEEGVMKEVTIPLERLEFMMLTNGIQTNVAKTRFDVSMFFAGTKAELDVFEGRHQGLIILEIEFRSKEASDNFSRITSNTYKEITGIEKYAGGKLAEW